MTTKGMTAQSVEKAVRAMEGWSRSDFDLFVRTMTQQYDAAARKVTLEPGDAAETIRMVEMEKDWYVPGGPASEQTALRL
ncbi:MAG: hypothetical protein IJ313_10495 [Clostridia bacterium]|nr:hypothetical protein [Clostridia bacterium]